MVERLCVSLGLSLTLCMCMVKRRCMVNKRVEVDGMGMVCRGEMM